LARYNASEKRRVVQAKANAKRIHVGGAYHSTARTIADARRINAHIKERLRELVERQSHRKEAQGAQAR
jgi:protein-arginine kinase activator protein McsA